MHASLHSSLSCPVKDAQDKVQAGLTCMMEFMKHRLPVFCRPRGMGRWPDLARLWGSTALHSSSTALCTAGSRGARISSSTFSSTTSYVQSPSMSGIYQTQTHQTQGLDLEEGSFHGSCSSTIQIGRGSGSALLWPPPAKPISARTGSPVRMDVHKSSTSTVIQDIFMLEEMSSSSFSSTSSCLTAQQD